jgi:hypothetical protein
LCGNLFGAGAIQRVELFFVQAPNIHCALSISRACPHSVGQHPFARKRADGLGRWAGRDRCPDPGFGGVGCGQCVLAGLTRVG